MKEEVDMAKKDLRSEYDFSKLGNPVKGKYAEAYKGGSNIILLDDDVAQAFPNEKAVNDALRLLMKIAKQQTNPTALK